MHILSGNQSASADRGVCVCVFFLNFVIFLTLRFQVSSADLCKKILIVRDILE